MLGLQLPNLFVPPLGRDSWREVDGLIVARNFCTERAPLWLPRVDQRGDLTGITGMEFPLLNFAAGKLGCVGVPQVPLQRSLTLLCSLLGLCAVMGLGRSFLSERGALAAGAMTAFAPVFLYYARVAQPDVAAVSLALVALWLLLGERTWLAALVLSVAILIKLPVVVFGLPALIIMLRVPFFALIRRASTWGFAAITVLPSFAWYAWARGLQRDYGLAYFNLGQGWAAADLATEKFWRLIFVQQLFDVYAFGLVSVAALLALALLRGQLPGWLRAMAFAVLVFFLLGGQVAAHHWYYGVVASPLLGLLAAALLDTRPRLLIALAVLSVGFGLWRTRSFGAHAGDELPLLAAKSALDLRVPPDARPLLISAADPTLLWFFERKAHLAPADADEAWLAAQSDRFPAVIIDRRRVPASLGPQLHNREFEKAFSAPQVEVWVHVLR